MDAIVISGFADEIDTCLDRQLDLLGKLGIKYLSLRGANGKNIADYTVEEVRQSLLVRLRAAGVGVSSLGSPIGKLDWDDEPGFVRQLKQLEELCKIAQLLECRYIRIFSFYVPPSKADACLFCVVEKIKKFAAVARRFAVTLLLENEKGLCGDTAVRSKQLLAAVDSPYCAAAFDFANFVQCGEDTERCWELLKEHVTYIHIKDARYTDEKNVVCGTGDGNIHAILRRALYRDGYQGFLALEPHLAVFDGLEALERGSVETVIESNGIKSGAEGFAIQYHALCGILEQLRKEERGNHG